MEPVTTVLLERGQEPEGLRKMLGASVALHVVAALAILISPTLWHARPASNDTLMTISLGGGPPGPMSGGMNPMGGQQVQTTEPAPRPEPAHPPAARTPEMTVPMPKGKPAPKVQSQADEGSGRTPIRGARPNVGAAFGQTGVEGTGTGLATGGFGDEGMSLDVGNFCCPEYLSIMGASIKRNWNEHQSVAGVTIVKFTIRRDGSIVDVALERTSGFTALDLSAQRALLLTKLPPLPAQYPNSTLTVHLRFESIGRHSP